MHGESSELKTLQLLLVKKADMTEPIELRCVSGRNQFDLNLSHSSVREDPGSALRQTPAKGTFWISLPSTLWLNELHTAAEGHHASPGKQRHWVEWAMCCGGRNVALDEMMQIDRMSRNID
jgi:hypothetical protein